ncbi:hypothetical protein Tcan_07629 [Toxocara canis]|uniref:Uncharacterized protein n=1 Tax=Toxocara canis TaxID=6265 RepID=A0A0B2V8T9_TOXCA|nr:hypothetical protein Tcan_07629 [Toxocara canis]
MTALGGTARTNHQELPREERTSRLLPLTANHPPLSPTHSLRGNDLMSLAAAHSGIATNCSVNLPPSARSNGGLVQRRLPQIPPINLSFDHKQPYADDINTPRAVPYDHRYILANRNMPLDVDEDEEWYERREANHVRHDERWTNDGMPERGLREPFLLARSQALAIAGVPPEMSDAFEGTYRPAPDGKSVRLPFSSRPVLRPAESNEEGLTERLVGEALGLGRYMDERVVEAARREIAEAYSLEESELESAAAALTDARYLEHLGMERSEVRDFNRYSASALLRPAPSQDAHEDDLLLVTTL